MTILTCILHFSYFSYFSYFLQETELFKYLLYQDFHNFKKKHGALLLQSNFFWVAGNKPNSAADLYCSIPSNKIMCFFFLKKCQQCVIHLCSRTENFLERMHYYFNMQAWNGHIFHSHSIYLFSFVLRFVSALVLTWLKTAISSSVIFGNRMTV